MKKAKWQLSDTFDVTQFVSLFGAIEAQVTDSTGGAVTAADDLAEALTPAICEAFDVFGQAPELPSTDTVTTIDAGATRLSSAADETTGDAGPPGFAEDGEGADPGECDVANGGELFMPGDDFVFYPVDPLVTGEETELTVVDDLVLAVEDGDVILVEAPGDSEAGDGVFLTKPVICSAPEFLL